MRSRRNIYFTYFDLRKILSLPENVEIDLLESSSNGIGLGVIVSSEIEDAPWELHPDWIAGGYGEGPYLEAPYIPAQDWVENVGDIGAES